jgi:hypothetical protein
MAGWAAGDGEAALRPLTALEGVERLGAGLVRLFELDTGFELDEAFWGLLLGVLAELERRPFVPLVEAVGVEGSAFRRLVGGVGMLDG